MDRPYLHSSSLASTSIAIAHRFSAPVCGLTFSACTAQASKTSVQRGDQVVVYNPIAFSGGLRGKFLKLGITFLHSAQIHATGNHSGHFADWHAQE